MRALVTGGNGFVGRHLVRELAARNYETIDPIVELRDAATLDGLFAGESIDVVFHLAAQAFVPRATEDPIETYDVNIMGTARLIEALRRVERDAKPRLIFVSSAEVYGIHGAAALPLAETALPRPVTPYAASKLAGEALALASGTTYGFDAIVTRAFNHIGPGQSERFAVAAFARRLAAIAAGGPVLFPVGNLETQRDFLDVRDVVRAYVDLAERGSPGEIYNVCSGVPTRMADVLRQLVMAARVGLEIREDPALMRRVDIPVIYGDNAKLKAATGWEPSLTLARSLREIYEDARAAGANAQA